MYTFLNSPATLTPFEYAVRYAEVDEFIEYMLSLVEAHDLDTLKALLVALEDLSYEIMDKLGYDYTSDDLVEKSIHIEAAIKELEDPSSHALGDWIERDEEEDDYLNY